jgi:mannose-6-phosphate isomerase class I
MYKDDNHKPEMALALEDFEALSSFVSHAELVAALQQQPELRACVGEANAAALEGCCEAGKQQVRRAGPAAAGASARLLRPCAAGGWLQQLVASAALAHRALTPMTLLHFWCALPP